MKIFSVIAVILALLPTSTVYGIDRCSAIFADPKKLPEDIRTVAQIALPASFKKVLLQRPIAHELQERFGDGKNLSVLLPYYSEEFAKTGQMPSWNMHVGETIQSLFIARTLKAILPKVSLRQRGYDYSERPFQVRLLVHDPAESGDSSSYGEDTVRMAAIKFANPGAGSFSRVQLRQKLGIPESNRVVSLNVGVKVSLEEIRELISTLLATKPNVIILSSARPFDRTELGMLRQTGPPFIPVRKFSTLDGSSFQGAEPQIIINDSVGKMYAIYGAADLSVMVGAINISEPLLANADGLLRFHKLLYGTVR